jgi:hypothetical protein
MRARFRHDDLVGVGVNDEVSVVGFRVAIFDEETFLAFLKAWIGWLQTFPPERQLALGDAAE